MLNRHGHSKYTLSLIKCYKREHEGNKGVRPFVSDSQSLLSSLQVEGLGLRLANQKGRIRWLHWKGLVLLSELV